MNRIKDSGAEKRETLALRPKDKIRGPGKQDPPQSPLGKGGGNAAVHTSTRNGEELMRIAIALTRRIRRLRFSAPVAHVYNPLVYAGDQYAEYIERFGRGEREIVLFGMNPGPWGMTQTGVPFGEVGIVRDWLKLSGRVRRPRSEHPKVLIRGFDCTRSEVSGSRLWGWAKDAFETPERFFSRFFVANYCPLVFLEESGRNRTPDKLPAEERVPLFAACDEALRETVLTMRPKFVIGVGAFAATRARLALENLVHGADQASLPDRTRGEQSALVYRPVVGEILHPSPASPAANRGWREAAVAQMRRIGITLPTGPGSIRQ